MPAMRDLPDNALPDLTETGRLGVYQLKRFWFWTLGRMAGTVPPADRQERHRNYLMIQGLGIGLEQMARFMSGQPDFNRLEDWIEEVAGPPERLERLNTALLHGAAPDAALDASAPVLGAADLRQWDEDGYVIVPQAAPPEVIAEAAAAVLALVGARADEPDSWYRGPKSGVMQGVMVQAFQLAASKAIRRAPRVAKAFAQLWASDDLWPTCDRVGFNPPERPGYAFPGPHLHWDEGLNSPVAFGTQGLVYLTDTPPEQGAFTLVPGFHRRIDAWLAALPAGADPQQQDLRALGARPIGGKAGDLVIWRSALPHGASANRGARPRLVQYVNYFPSGRRTLARDPRG